MLRTRTFRALAVALCIGAATIANAHKPAHKPGDDARELVRIAVALDQKNDAAGAAKVLAQVLVSPGFGLLDAGEQHAVLSAAGSAALDRHADAEAHAMLVRATASPDADPQDWHNRMAAAYTLKDFTDSARCLAKIARTWPKTLDKVRDGAVYEMVRKTLDTPDGVDNAFELLASLYDAHWTDGGEQPDSLWVDYAGLLLERGDTAKAVEVAAHVASPWVLMMMRVDRRFDALAPQEAPAAEIDRVKTAQLKRLQRRSLDHPKNLQFVFDYQYALMTALQCAQALAVGDNAIAHSIDAGGKPTYDDFDEKHVWMLDLRAEALTCSQRYDDAIAQRVTAAKAMEKGAQNVSQVLNLGGLYAALHRPDDAERAVAGLADTIVSVGGMNAYGRMQLEHIHVMAAVDRKDANELAKHLEFMTEHKADARSTYMEALLDADRADVAAAFLIERLRDPHQRGDALATIQILPDGTATPRAQERERRLRSLLARSDVASEVARFGRIERFELAR